MAFDLSQYETVEDRLERFWEAHPDGRVETEMVFYDENRVVFKATIFRNANDTVPVATGHAEELRGSSPVNRTSHLENGETSSLAERWRITSTPPKASVHRDQRWRRSTG